MTPATVIQFLISDVPARNISSGTLDRGEVAFPHGLEHFVIESFVEHPMGETTGRYNCDRLISRPGRNAAGQRPAEVEAAFGGRLVRRIKSIHEYRNVRHHPVSHQPPIHKA